MNHIPVSLSQPFNFQLTVKTATKQCSPQKCYANKQQAWLFVWLGTSVWLTTHKHLQMGPFPGGHKCGGEGREGEEERGVTEEMMDCRAAEVLEPHKMLQMLSEIMMKGYNYRDSNVILDVFVPTVLLASWMELVCVCFEHLLLVAILLSIADAYTHY